MLSAAQNLADSIRKPSFRFNNTNWQLWQTNTNNYNNSNNITGSNSTYNKNDTILEEPDYLSELSEEAADVSEETAYDSYYTQYTTPDSMDCGSDNLLVTFDYGYSDSIEPSPLVPSAGCTEDNYWPEAENGEIWFGTPPGDAQAFKVHHVQHKGGLASLISYDVDEFEEQSEPASESDNEQGRVDEEVFYDSIECWKYT